MAKPDKAPEIILPKSFHIPEGDGDDPTEFEAVVTFKLQPNDKVPGKALLIQIGDHKFGEEEEKEPDEEKPDYKDLSKSMVQDMTTPVEGGGGSGMGSMNIGGGY